MRRNEDRCSLAVQVQHRSEPIRTLKVGTHLRDVLQDAGTTTLAVRASVPVVRDCACLLVDAGA